MFRSQRHIANHIEQYTFTLGKLVSLLGWNVLEAHRWVIPSYTKFLLVRTKGEAMKYLLLLCLIGCSNEADYENELATRATNKWCSHEQINTVIHQVKECTAKGGNVNHCWNVGIINNCESKHGHAK